MHVHISALNRENIPRWRPQSNFPRIMMAWPRGPSHASVCVTYSWQVVCWSSPFTLK